MKMDHIAALLFDYGGTIDSNGLHWSEVIWQAYEAEDVPVTKEDFRAAYVHAERTMAQLPLVRPEHTFADMMRIKIDLQVDWLQEQTALPDFRATRDVRRRLAGRCYASAERCVAAARPLIAALAERYPLALVSNFYGNIGAVLHDFRLDRYFLHVIESAVVGVRKPDPAIFRLGLDALGISDASSAVVIGDSYDKDILPAASLGCRTVWLKNIGWKPYTGAEQADVVITTALIPGRKAPVLVTRAMVESMRPGSVVVDMAVEQGGNCELSKADNVVRHQGVSIAGVGNLPAMVPADASAFYARNILDFLKLIVDDEKKLKIDLEDDIVKACLVARDGQVLREQKA